MAKEKKTPPSNLNKEKLRKLAYEAHLTAYAPYSHAHVGSAILTSNGQFYSGCNVENGSFGATICAERNAIGMMVRGSDTKIDTVYVYTKQGWPPCGMCRQVIKEFATQSTTIIIGDEKGKEQVISFDEIYPHSFGPDDMEELS